MTVDGDPARLVVNEIFYSIQGESSYAGLPCVLVRLTGCNLRCVWCDTAYAFYEGQPMTVPAVLAEVRRFGCRLVEITGGEPLLQRGVYPLTEALLAEGYQVLIETGGSLSVADLDPRVVKIVDLKPPGSGMADQNYWPNLQWLDKKDQVKFVIRDRLDYEWSRKVIGEHGLLDRVQVLLSPVHGELPPRDLAEWILADRLPVRMQVQLHKVIWGAEARGV